MYNLLLMSHLGINKISVSSLNESCEIFAAFEIASTNIVPVEIEPTAAVVPPKMVFKLNFLNTLKNTGQGDPPSSAPAV